jgi:DNA repair protein RecO (recombination protein O)
MIVRTPAIVFRTVDYQESTYIVTVFTRELGKIAVMAKGARKPKSQYAGLFEIGTQLDMVLYNKASRGIQPLKEASYLHRNFSNRSDVFKMVTVQRIIELVNQMLHDQEVNEEKWDFISTLLNWLDSQKQPSQNLFPYVQLRLSEIQGIGLSLDQVEEISSNKGTLLGIDIESGMITDRAHAARFYPLSAAAIEFLIQAITSKSSQVLDFALAKDERIQLVQTLDQYLSYHIESVRARKTDQIYKDFL